MATRRSRQCPCPASQRTASQVYCTAGWAIQHQPNTLTDWCFIFVARGAGDFVLLLLRRRFIDNAILSFIPAERDSGRRSPKCATHRPKTARGPRKTSGKWSLAFRLTQISRHRECRCEILVRSRVGAAKRALRITAHHRVNIHLPKGLGVEFPGRFEFMPIALRVPLARWYHLGVGAV